MSMRHMQVGLVVEAQHESLIDLLCELHAFYNDGAVVSRTLVREHLLDNLLAAGSSQRLVVAADEGGAVVGLAAITLVYSLVEFSAEKRRHCQLKELYVRSSSRSDGAGRALMSWVARYALEHGCRRIDWPVKASNDRGIAFYESLGAARVADRLAYRLGEPALNRLALGLSTSD
jgi:ribosomal protein S18 acetylase RimI-like enzyme